MSTLKDKSQSMFGRFMTIKSEAISLKEVAEASEWFELGQEIKTGCTNLSNNPAVVRDRIRDIVMKDPAKSLPFKTKAAGILLSMSKP
jgi:hypothetical protein